MITLKKNLEQELREFYVSVPTPPDSHAIENLVKYAAANRKSEIPDRMSFWQFYFSQFTFIRKRTWITQLILLFFIVYIFVDKNETQAILTWFSAISPLIMLCGVKEILRTFMHRTYEIEVTTIYTVRQVMLTRAGIIGGLDIVCITSMMIFAGIRLDYPWMMLFLYILVPFLITCFGCLYILNRARNTESLYYCYGYGIIIDIVVIIMSLHFPHLYSLSLVGGWIVFFIISVIGVIRELWKLNIKIMKRMDKIPG